METVLASERVALACMFFTGTAFLNGSSGDYHRNYLICDYGWFPYCVFVVVVSKR